MGCNACMHFGVVALNKEEQRRRPLHETWVTDIVRHANRRAIFTHDTSRRKTVEFDSSTNRILRSVKKKDFSDTSVNFLEFGAQNIAKEPHWHNPAQLPSQSFSDSVHCVANAAAYCLASILPLGFSNHYPPHLRRVWLAPSPPRPFSTVLENSGNFLDISFILQCVLREGCDNISDWSILRKIRFVEFRGSIFFSQPGSSVARLQLCHPAPAQDVSGGPVHTTWKRQTCLFICLSLTLWLSLAWSRACIFSLLLGHVFAFSLSCRSDQQPPADKRLRLNFMLTHWLSGDHLHNSFHSYNTVTISSYFRWTSDQNDWLYLMRYGVAKCWVSEQEGVRAHARLVFVDK